LIYNKKEDTPRGYGGSMKKVNFSVTGVKCGGCVSKIENGLKDEAGILNIAVSVDNQLVTLELEDSAKPMLFKKQIEELGFPVSKMAKE
jgi:copper chaperone CopZ